jgi:hypothetical protein
MGRASGAHGWRPRGAQICTCTRHSCLPRPCETVAPGPGAQRRPPPPCCAAGLDAAGPGGKPLPNGSVTPGGALLLAAVGYILVLLGGCLMGDSVLRQVGATLVLLGGCLMGGSVLRQVGASWKAAGWQPGGSPLGDSQAWEVMRAGEGAARGRPRRAPAPAPHTRHRQPAL